MNFCRVYILAAILFIQLAHSQQTIIKGSVLDAVTAEALPDALITIEKTSIETKTDETGNFILDYNLPLGNQILKIEKFGYMSKRFPIIIYEGRLLDLSGITLEYDPSAQKDLFVITLSEDQLNSEEDGVSSNISGLLQSSRDVFLTAAAYDFSSSFYRPRGLDNANGKVLINGIEFNKLYNGRPLWANWGGLNDAQRNQEFTMGMSPNDYAFGDIAGTNNIVMRASRYVKGGRFSLASANKSYKVRGMATYSSGLLDGGWSYTLSASGRYGNEGFIEGTPYMANSLFVAVEKQLDNDHSINFSGIYAQNLRGRSTAISEEIYNIKGRTYNPFWGYQNGKIRNARTREVNEPIIMLNHYWDISTSTKLNNNLSYQFGQTSNSRIDNGGTRLINFNGQETYIGGGRNPDPSYYQFLPSYFFRNSGDSPTSYQFEQAFIAEKALKENGQLNWDALYRANFQQSGLGHNGTYILQEDKVDDHKLTFNSILDSEITDIIRINAAINLTKLKSENYALVGDLLGGNGFLDVDFFAEETGQSTDDALENIAQSDLRNRNRIVREGERYKYNYIINASVLDAFGQAQLKFENIDIYFGAKFAKTYYQRNGLFENGNFPGRLSFGNSKKLNFEDYGIKTGLTYKLTGRHLLDLNASYYTKAPSIRTAFNNPRQNNEVVNGLKSEKVSAIDFSYLFRSPLLKGRLTGFYSEFRNGTDVGVYFTEDLGGQGINEGDAFIQEVLTNVQKQNIGLEIGVEAQITTTIKLKTAASVGQYIYSNNPEIYLTSDDFQGELRFGNGKTSLKNYHVGGGPESVFQLGFEYRNPDYWWMGLTTNYFTDTYINISKLSRSENFSTDFDGNSFSDYNPGTAKELLKQEKFDNYFLVNLVGGKSWLIKKYFIGFFASINNILDKEYKTGGFEQSRLSNYKRINEDVNRPNGRIFGPRYFFGSGTTYFLNLYVRF